MARNVWAYLAEQGRLTGIFEAYSRRGRDAREWAERGQRRCWDFERENPRRLGRGFRAALRRSPNSELKSIAMDIERELRARGRLTDKQWRYLGLIMTKIDPACTDNPTVEIPAPARPVSTNATIIIRRGGDPATEFRKIARNILKEE